MARTRRQRSAVLVVAAMAMALSAIGPTPDADATGVRYLDEVFDELHGRAEPPLRQSVNYQGVMQQHLLDVLQPAGDTVTDRRAAVVWVHGGFFKRGSKDVEWYQEAREQFVKAGYVVFSINYRLNESLPEGLLPTVQTLRLEEYIQRPRTRRTTPRPPCAGCGPTPRSTASNPDKIAIAGHSAGGIISQMVGFNEHDPAPAARQACRRGWPRRRLLGRRHAAGGARQRRPGRAADAPVPRRGRRRRALPGRPPRLRAHGRAGQRVRAAARPRPGARPVRLRRLAGVPVPRA